MTKIDRDHLRENGQYVPPRHKGERIYEEFCKHQGLLSNQGVTFCYAGLDPSNCSNCKQREPVKHICKVTFASM